MNSTCPCCRSHLTDDAGIRDPRHSPQVGRNHENPPPTHERNMTEPMTPFLGTRTTLRGRLAGIGCFVACVGGLVVLGCKPDTSRQSTDSTAVVASTATGETASAMAAPTDSTTAPSAPVSDSLTARAVVPAAPATAESAAAQAGRTKPAAATRHAPATARQHARTSADSTAAATPTPAESTTTTSSSSSADTGATSTAGTSDTTKVTPSLAVTQQVYDGWKMFSVYCYRCHGIDAMGSDIAPNLRHSLGPEGGVTHAIFLQTVTNGRPGTAMPSWKALLDTTQMENIYAYLKARSSGALPPGRPHVKK